MPFQSTEKDVETTAKLGVGTRLEPYTVIAVAPDPTMSCVGKTWSMTGVGIGGRISNHAPDAVPPPGAWVKTPTRNCCDVIC